MNESEEKLSKKIENVEKALTAALEAEGLTMTMIIDFPRYREFPIPVKLALALFESEGGTLCRQYQLKKEPEPSPKNPPEKK